LTTKSGLLRAAAREALMNDRASVTDSTYRRMERVLGSLAM